MKGSRAFRIIRGIVWSNVAALGLIYGSSLLVNWVTPPDFAHDITLAWLLSSFVVVPVLMGLISSLTWRDLDLSRTEINGYSLLNLVTAIGLSTFVLREGVVCLIMALPLVALFLLIGTSIGFSINRRKSNLRVTIVPLLLAVLIVDTLTAKGFDSQVTDRIVIHAPPEKVWKYVIDYPPIAEPSDYWLHRIGLPAPVQSTSTGHAVGETRRCIFTGNTVFDERITEMEPNKKLTFVITTQPNHPEIIGHIVLRKGQFLLKDNGDGTTTLTGTSWYTLNVHPAAYYDLWATSIVRDVHERVFAQIERLAEVR